MASNHSQGGSNSGGSDGGQRRPPEWADGLKQLYDSVVEEDLPDAFKDLLDRLESLPTAAGPRGGSPSSDGPDTSQ